MKNNNGALRWVLTLFMLLSLTSFSYAGPLDAVCDTVAKAATCKASINIPTLSIKTCKQDWFKPDPCKTKFKGRYPCGVSWRGVKWCDGWTCVPGTVKTIISVPCGVNVGSQKLDLCGLVRKAIPGADELIRQAAGYCRCLPKVFAFVDLDTVKTVVKSYDISAGTGDILQKYSDVQQCLIDNSFNVQDNKKGLTTNTGALVQSDTVKVFTAAEINLARYTSFALAITPCFVTVCSETLIRGWFTDYLTDSETAMSKQLKSFLTPWEQSFDKIQANFQSIGGDLDQIETQFGTVQQSVEQIANDFCKNFTACAETTVSKLKAKVDSTVQSSKAVIGLKTQVTTIVTDTQQLVNIVSDAIKAFDTLADLGIDAIFAKIVSGQLRSIKEVAETLQAAKRLPDIIKDMQKVLPNVQKYVTQLETLGPDFIKNIDDIVSTTWVADARADAARFANGEAAVSKIQSLFKDKIVAHVKGFGDSITSVLNALKALALSGPPSIDVRVASYQRWSEGHFSMPCLTTGKITLKLGGYSQKVDYPKFYRCEQPYKIPFPNHHIPYVKIVFSTSPQPAARARNLYLERREVGVDEPTEVVNVEIPTATESVWPYVSDMPAGFQPFADANGTLENIPVATDPNATEVILDSGGASATTSFALPTDLCSNSDQCPMATTYPASVVFFETTDANGATVTADTTLTNATTLEVSTTVALESTESTIGTYTTPTGFVEGELKAVSASGAVPSSTGATPGSSATSGSGQSGGGGASTASATPSARSSGNSLRVGSIWLMLFGIVFVVLFL